MRKAQKMQVEELLRQLEQAHEQIKEYIDQKSSQLAIELLKDCQDAGISIGTLIERTEGEGHLSVSQLEEYCELIYQIYEDISEEREIGANKTYKLLRQKLIKVSNSVRNDIPIRKEAVFLPYKASMWDSLESVWQAANADPDCDAYVIPIPYYDRNPDGSFGRMHYEGDQYPENVPITKYDIFDFGAHHPDMIFIHNPYDDCNLVTSIDPFFYSDKLKKVTDCLVYIPYFAASGGMGESKALCPAYVNADYIVIQSEKYREFFDKRLPDEKFLAFGSPKFDSVIHKCQNPPELPAEWKERMAGKKVYFYNTSISGMLANTDAFLKKMRYVFDTFKGREDACLLWRPHPLLESSFDSMRKLYKPQFDALKKEFVEENIGILDKTADIESSIALSDVYVGDSESSVTSLFGVAGKPLFTLNNYIHTLPEKDDWRGEWLNFPLSYVWGNDKYLITKSNQMWVSENNDYHYSFFMDFGCEYSGTWYYIKAVEIQDKIYVLPYYATDLLVIDNKNIKKIDLKCNHNQPLSFWNYYYNDKYIFLLPFRHPYVVRYDIEKDEVTYIDGVAQFNVQNVDGKWLMGGVAPFGDDLIFASPADDQFMFVNMDTLEMRVLRSNCKSNRGTYKIVSNDDELWLLPFRGTTIICWNPQTNEVREYSNVPEGFKSIVWPYNYESDEKPFSNIAISNITKENILISPCYGNMYLSLDRVTGKMEEWRPQIAYQKYKESGYFATAYIGYFLSTTLPQNNNGHITLWCCPERKIYDVDIDTKTIKEMEMELEYDDLVEHMPGFAEQSGQLPYCLLENAFNSLKDLLDGNITGNSFDRERQIKAFSKINANTDGTCGKSVYDFVKGRV